MFQKQVLLLLLVFLLIGVVSVLRTEQLSEDTERKRCANSTLAYLMVQGSLRERQPQDDLDFPRRTEISVKRMPACRHEITAYYMARDESGKYLRFDYTAVMHYAGNNYWQLESLATH